MFLETRFLLKQIAAYPSDRPLTSSATNLRHAWPRRASRATDPAPLFLAPGFCATAFTHLRPSPGRRRRER